MKRKKPPASSDAHFEVPGSATFLAAVLGDGPKSVVSEVASMMPKKKEKSPAADSPPVIKPKEPSAKEKKVFISTFQIEIRWALSLPLQGVY